MRSVIHWEGDSFFASIEQDADKRNCAPLIEPAGIFAGMGPLMDTPIRSRRNSAGSL